MGDREPTLDRVRSPPRRDLSADLVRSGELIDRGGNALVSVAALSDERSPDRIAVKEPLAPGTLENDEIERFLSQAETWETVDRIERERPRWRDSEHVVGVVDTGERLPWIAMEYMDGGTLADRLAAVDGGLPTLEVLWIGECVCRGVAVAHSLGIAHLDLKPANVLFRSTPDGVWDVPKVADWGLARVLADQTGTVEGLSPAYAAPEQFEPGEFGEPDTLTDIYQVGTILYELLTGTPIAPESRFQAMQVAMSSDPVSPPSAERPALSPAVDAVVSSALERDKTDRYSAIPVMADALRAVRTGGDLPPIVGDRLDGRSERTGDARPERTDTSTPPAPERDDERAATNDGGAGDPELVERVTDYDNYGSYSASPGDHDGVTTGRSDGHADDEASSDDPRTHPASESESMADRVAAYENHRSVNASPGDHTAVAAESTNGAREPRAASGLPPRTAGWPTLGGNFARTGTSGDPDGPESAVSVAWTHSTPDLVKVAPAVSDGIVYAGPERGTLRALDAQTGETVWTSGRLLETASAPAVADGQVFAGSWSGDLYAVDAVTGDTQWTFETGSHVYGPPTVADGTVYFGGRGGTLYAVAADSGEQRWRVDCGAIKSAPTVSGGTVYVGTKAETVHAVDAHSGETVWTYQTERPVWSSPAVVDGSVYVGCWDDSLYALDRSTGDLDWQFDTERSIPGSVAVRDDSLFVGNNANNVYALDPTSGESRWQQSLSGSVRTAVAVLGETLIAGCADGTLTALSTTTGHRRWSVDVGSSIHASPAVAAGTVYLGTADGVYALAGDE
ncbi:outer membrane protein assembly factor BamB family protein [Halomicrobium mukohataei]|uniref:Serine/threonine protein kinase n=2 Tax=Halomicrobium mukohataei TaxID=57705 RepID=C7P501_HALMD|nr:serine/threonine-protein kinase [Halomicrobium mukohataei]ACV49396.1 serine/threonine protein kinase [Halomicrobium mukohataei DSM 12286]QCD67223.1 serine/threonine protein kinase [Halomicrobium mukohataei]